MIEMANRYREITIYLDEDDGEIIIYDETNSKEIANYDWLDLSKSYQLEEFTKDMMSLQNVISYDDIKFK